MQRRQLVLAVLATAGTDAWTPVQVQKVFFLIDRKIPERVSGPHFNFRPYDYGPFDPQVYRELEELEATGLATIGATDPFSMREYRLTGAGQREGRRLLESFSADVRGYFERAARFVRTRSFPELVSAIYEAFPDMRVNSVFRSPNE